MRSRNGNRSFTLSLYTLIFFHSLALNASEYLISYRYSVKDAVLFNETLQVSNAMQKCAGQLQRSFILEANADDSLQNIIHNNYSKFIDNIHKIGLDIQHSDVTINSINSSMTILTLHTTCFKVDFNDNYAKITPLK